MSENDRNNIDHNQPKAALRGKGQAERLGQQHELAGGPVGIFGEAAGTIRLTYHN